MSLQETLVPLALGSLAMEDQRKFRQFEKEPADITQYIKATDNVANHFADAYDIEKMKDGFSISVDIQQYIDEAVTKMRNAVRDQVETNLQSILRQAFEATLSSHFSPIVVKALWEDFLSRLALAANVKIEDRT